MRCTSGYALILRTDPPVTAEGYDGSHFTRYTECDLTVQCSTKGQVKSQSIQQHVFRKEESK